MHNNLIGYVQPGQTIVERGENGSITKKIPVRKVERGICTRTKVHINGAYCYDDNTVIEIE